jgi:hypothetical protein
VDLASPSALRSGVEHSCVVEQCSELTGQVQEESAVVFSGMIVSKSKLMLQNTMNITVPTNESLFFSL